MAKNKIVRFKVIGITCSICLICLYLLTTLLIFTGEYELEILLCTYLGSTLLFGGIMAGSWYGNKKEEK